jgi:hypothetical protein
MPIAEPDYLICRECETPCYNFDWDSMRAFVLSAFCEMCGNDSPEAFKVPDDDDVG